MVTLIVDIQRGYRGWHINPQENGVLEMKLTGMLLLAMLSTDGCNSLNYNKTANNKAPDTWDRQKECYTLAEEFRSSYNDDGGDWSILHSHYSPKYNACYVYVAKGKWRDRDNEKMEYLRIRIRDVLERNFVARVDILDDEKGNEKTTHEVNGTDTDKETFNNFVKDRMHN